MKELLSPLRLCAEPRTAGKEVASELMWESDFNCVDCVSELRACTMHRITAGISTKNILHMSRQSLVQLSPLPI